MTTIVTAIVTMTVTSSFLTFHIIVLLFAAKIGLLAAQLSFKTLRSGPPRYRQLSCTTAHASKDTIASLINTILTDGYKMSPRNSPTTGSIVNIYTDGSSIGNGTDHAIAGVGIHVTEYPDLDISLPVPLHHPQTNQVAELLAVGEAVKLAERFDSTFIYTDSAYAYNTLTDWHDKWKARNWTLASGAQPKNLDIIREIKSHMNLLSTMGRKVVMFKVAGHSGDIGNERAHNLASAATKAGERRDLALAMDTITKAEKRSDADDHADYVDYDDSGIGVCIDHYIGEVAKSVGCQVETPVGDLVSPARVMPLRVDTRRLSLPAPVPKYVSPGSVTPLETVDSTAQGEASESSVGIRVAACPDKERVESILGQIDTLTTELRGMLL